MAGWMMAARTAQGCSAQRGLRKSKRPPVLATPTGHADPIAPLGGAITDALERLARGRGVALIDLEDGRDVVLTSGEPFLGGMIRTQAASIHAELAAILDDATEEDGEHLARDSKAAAIALRLSLLREAVRRVDLRNPAAAEGFLLGAGLSLLSYDLIEAVAAVTAGHREQIKGYDALFGRLANRRAKQQAKMASAVARTRRSDQMLAVFEWLQSDGAARSASRIKKRLAEQYDMTEERVDNGLRAARRRRTT